MKNYRAVTFLAFMLSPLLTLPFILKGIYNREKGSAFFMALFLGVLAFLTAPCGDLARHTRDYFMYQDMSFSSFLMTLDKDFMIQIMSFSFGKMGIPYDFIRLLLTTAEFYLLIKIFNFQIEHSPHPYSRWEIWFRFLILFFSFDFFITVLGVRFGFAICLFIYAVHLWLNRGKWKWAIVTALLSCAVHFSMAYFSAFVLCTSLFHTSKFTSILLIASCFVLSQTILSQLHVYMETNEFSGTGYLGDGKWGTGYRYTFNNLMFYYIRKLAVLPLAFLAFKYSRKGGPWSFIMLSLIALYALTSHLTTISDRIIWIFYAMTIFYVLYLEKLGPRLGRTALTAIFCCGVLFTGSSWYARRAIISVSRYPYALLPVPAALSYHYSKAWVSKRLSKEYLFLD